MNCMIAVPLFEDSRVGTHFFQDVFVGFGKWFRGCRRAYGRDVAGNPGGEVAKRVAEVAPEQRARVEGQGDGLLCLREGGFRCG
jgi:hypothetical protein